MKQTPASRKLNEAAREALAMLLLTEVSDPRLDMITITAVEVSKDRAIANVFVTTDVDKYESLNAGLNSAKGRLRSLLGSQLGWRVTPELRFFIDTGVDHAQSIDFALHAAAAQGEQASDWSSTEDSDCNRNSNSATIDDLESGWNSSPVSATKGGVDEF